MDWKVDGFMLKQYKVGKLSKEISQKERAVNNLNQPRTQAQAIRFGERQSELQSEISSLKSKKRSIEEKPSLLERVSIFGKK